MITRTGRSGCQLAMRLAMAVVARVLFCLPSNFCQVTLAPCSVKCFSRAFCCLSMPAEPLTRVPIAQMSSKCFMARAASNGGWVTLGGALSWANSSFWGMGTAFSGAIGRIRATASPTAVRISPSPIISQPRVFKGHLPPPIGSFFSKCLMVPAAHSRRRVVLEGRMKLTI